MAPPSDNSTVLITERVEMSNQDLTGIVGRVVDVNDQEDKVLIDPEYRVENVEVIGDDPLGSERIWIKTEKLAVVYRREDVIQVGGSNTHVEIEGKRSQYFGIEEI